MRDGGGKICRDSGRLYLLPIFKPTVSALNHRAAILEGGEAALSTASGMAAILATVMGICQAAIKLYVALTPSVTTLRLLDNFIGKFSVTVEYVNSAKTEDWDRAITSDTVLLLLETPSNPMLEVADIAALAVLAQKAGAVLAVDNCFCPFGQKPLSMGAIWSFIPAPNTWTDKVGQSAAYHRGKEIMYEKIYPFLRSGGPAISPFNAWVHPKRAGNTAIEDTGSQ